MGEPSSETPRSEVRGHLVTFTLAMILLTVAYPLSMAPMFKLCIDHPSIGSRVGDAFMVVYNPVLVYIWQHPGSRLELLSYWNATRVWNIPMVRN